jgi:hypothetical protein
MVFSNVWFRCTGRTRLEKNPQVLRCSVNAVNSSSDHVAFSKCHSLTSLIWDYLRLFLDYDGSPVIDRGQWQ